jgi:hypothetical protein
VELDSRGFTTTGSGRARTARDRKRRTVLRYVAADIRDRPFAAIAEIATALLVACRAE